MRTNTNTQTRQNGNEGPEIETHSFPGMKLRFHLKHLCLFQGKEGIALETGMETKGSNWKRAGNEGPKVETNRKQFLTLDGNEAPLNTSLRFHARSFVSTGNALGVDMETKLTDSPLQDQISPFRADHFPGAPAGDHPATWPLPKNEKRQ